MDNTDEKFFDIYLWTFPENNKLIKISHLTHDEATRLSDKWYELNELHDFMLVLEGSTPFMDEPSVTLQTKEWLEEINDIDQL